KDDEVVVEATGNAMAVVRMLSPYVARVIVANPLQVKAIAHAHVKTDKIDAGVLASLRAADFLPEVWLPDPDTERLRRLVARRNQIVRHRTRIKNEVHAILHAHLIPPCPHADLFGRLGRIWLPQQVMPDDECAAIERHLRELDRLSEDLGVLDTQIAQAGSADPAVTRLLTITGVNLIVVFRRGKFTPVEGGSASNFDPLCDESHRLPAWGTRVGGGGVVVWGTICRIPPRPLVH